MLPFIKILKLFILISSINIAFSSIDFCESYLEDDVTCSKCYQGFQLAPSTNESSTQICISDCLSILYFQQDTQSCVSSCNYNQIGDSTNRVCRDAYPCPILMELGQDFHSGPATQVIIDSRSIDSTYRNMITISDEDNQIKLWNLSTGELKATFSGHTQPILKAHLIEQDNELISISSNGEIIFWNYITGSIKQKQIVSLGKLTNESQIDVQFKRVSVFGFQGEFFVYNYEQMTLTKFIGHTNIVVKAIFRNETQLITYSKDKSIILWNILQSSQFQILCVADSTSADIVLLDFVFQNISNQFSSYSFLFSYGSEGDDSKVLYISDLNSDTKACKKYIQDVLTDSIQSLIIDSNSYSIIVVSQSQIIIYGFNIQQSNFILLQQINSEQYLLNQIQPIKGAYLNENYFLLYSDQGKYLILNYSNQNNKLQTQQQTIIQSLQQKPNQLSRQIINGIIIDIQNGMLYIYGEQIVTLDLVTQNVIYFISNLAIPYTINTSKILMLQKNEVQNIIASTSSDGRTMAFDYITGQLIQQFYHPEYLSKKESVQQIDSFLVLVKGILACIAYDDMNVVCYHIISGAKQYQKTFPQSVNRIDTDDTNGYILVYSFDYIFVINPFTQSIISSKQLTGSFVYINFYTSLVLITVSKDGNIVRFNYPDLSIKCSASTQSINTGKQKMVAFTIETQLDGMTLYFFENGLWIVYDIDLQLVKYHVESQQLTRCGIINIYLLSCLTADGYILYRGIMIEYYAGQKLFDFPLTDADILKQYPKGLFLIDFKIFGGSLVFVDANTLMFDQQFRSPYTISKFCLDESKQRILVGNVAGDITINHFNPDTHFLLDRTPDVTQIQKLSLLQAYQKVVILSNIITIYDYFEKKIIKTNKNHSQDLGIKGVTIIEDLQIIISFNSDISNNLQIWNYQTDQFKMLDGHISGINGVQYVNQNSIFISYDQQGIVIVWKYSSDLSKVSVYQTIKQHQNNNIVNLYIFNQYNPLFISFDQSGNLFITNYMDGIIKNAIRLPTMKQITLDYLNERIFFYGNNISVYSITSGSKITDLLGFDNNVQAVIFKNNYIIAYGTLIVQSFQRDTLKLLYSSKFKKDIYQASILKNLVGMVGFNVDNTVEMWDYTNGVMLSEIKNTLYPTNIIGITQDEDAELFIIYSSSNQIFTVTPFSNSFNQVKDFLLAPMGSSYIQNLIFDEISNILFAYNSDTIIVWNFYSYLGYEGQAIFLPTNSLIMSTYQEQQDIIAYADIESNIWKVQNNILTYKLKLDYTPLELKLHKNTYISIDGQYVYSYDLNFQQVSKFELNSYKIYLDDKIPYVFIQTYSYNIIQFLIDENTSQLKEIKQYSNHSNRIIQCLINIEYGHIITYDVTGKLAINNYITFQNFQLPKQHTAQIRDIQINFQLKRIITCSEDMKNFIFYYDYDNEIKEIITLSQTTQSVQSLVDNSRNEVLIWNDLQQIIQVINLEAKSEGTLKSTIKAPGDYLVQMKFNDKYHVLAVFNPFQINLHNRLTGDTIINNLRMPSQLQNITDVQFLSGQLFLLISKSSLRLIRFTSKIIQTEKIFNMDYPYLLSLKYENSLMIQIKGANLNTIFNYTFPFADDQIKQGYEVCYSNLQRTSSQFQLSQDISLQSTSLQKINQNIKSIVLNIEMDSVQDFLFVRSSTNFITDNNQIQQLYTYNKKPYLTNIEKVKLRLSSFLEFDQEDLSLKNFEWNIQDLNVYQLNPATKRVVFVNSSFQQNITGSQLMFDSLRIFQIDKLKIQNLSFLNKWSVQNLQIDEKQSFPFLSISNSEYVYINELSISNVKIQSPYTLVQLLKVSNVVILNLKIDNLSYFVDKDQEDDWSSLFSFQNCGNIVIQNISIINIQKYVNSDQYKSQRYAIFSMKANKQINIQSMLFEKNDDVILFDISQSFLQNDLGYFKVIHDIVNITDLNILNSTSVDGFAFVIIESDNFNLISSHFDSITCLNSFGCALDIKQTVFTIMNCTFENSVSLNGGAISIRESPGKNIIKSSSFQTNQASIGGAIYLDNSNLQIENTEIQWNKADIGGAIRYLNLIPDFIINKQHQKGNLFKNIIQGNKAQIFGQNVGSYPRSMNILSSTNITFYQKQDKSYLGEVYELDEFMSGDTLNFKVQVFDEDGEIVNLKKIDKIQNNELKKEISQFSLDCISTNSNLSITSSKAAYENDSLSFKFSDILIKASPSSSEVFYVDNNMVQIPDPLSNKLFYSLSSYMKIEIKFRDCQRGEIFVKSLDSPSYCLKCPQEKYSLVVPDPEGAEQTCKLCPEFAFYCEGKDIKLKNGYWRKNQYSDVIVECVNKPENCQDENSNSRNNCKAGYIGPLCESCDLFGEVWDSKYMNDGKFNCVSCQNSESLLLMMLVSVTIGSVYLIFGIRSAIMMNIIESRRYYLRVMKIASIGNSDSSNQSDIYLKLLLHFFQTSSIIYSVNLPKALLLFQVSIGTPIESLNYSLDCKSIFASSEIPPVYGRIIWAQIIPIGYIGFLILIYQILYMAKVVQKLNSKTIITGLIFMFIFLQPNIISGLVSIISCRQIGGNNYITADVTLGCYTQSYYKYIGILFVPLFLIWAVFIPLIWLIRLNQQKNKLNFCSVRLKYGFLYQEYKPQQFYWEFIKINFKLLIIFISTFFNQELSVKTTLLTVSLFCYLLLSLFKHPYICKPFNLCDQYMNIVLILCLQMNIFVQTTDNIILKNIGAILLFTINYSFIAYLCIKIIYGKFKKYLMILVNNFPNLKISLKKLLVKFKIFEINQTRAFRNWAKAIKLIRKNLIQHNKTNQENQGLLETNQNTYPTTTSRANLRLDYKTIRLSKDSIFTQCYNGSEETQQNSSSNYKKSPIFQFYRSQYQDQILSPVKDRVSEQTEQNDTEELDQYLQSSQPTSTNRQSDSNKLIKYNFNTKSNAKQFNFIQKEL